jgi:4-hydroxybenzoyl-CoA reductase subunit beta
MMRLPRFHYVSPSSVQEAAERLAEAGDAIVVAGGTDVLPNMKRRQQTPSTLIGLRRIQELVGVEAGDGLTLGAGLTLASLLRLPQLGGAYAGLRQAAAQVATPLLRNMGTLGGNLCLDTRCNYYDQSQEWRKAIGFCLKKDGDTCWVAPSSARCLAVSSTDTAPMLVALQAWVTLVAADRTRRIPVSSLYQNDGIHYLTRQPTEILTAVHLPRLDGWRSAYWKLRRRGSFDFPVLSAAVAVKLAADGAVEDARIVLGAVSSRPVESDQAAASLVGRPLTDAAIARAAELAAGPARPMDNTDFPLTWRKRAVREFVSYALQDVRGDAVGELRRRRQAATLIVQAAPPGPGARS